MGDMGSIDTDTETHEKNHTTLLLDVRNHDEVDTIKYKDGGTSDVLYMPANIIKYNLEFLHEYFQKYKQVYIICQSGNRSKIIKNKYFSNDEHVMINSLHFNKLDGERTPGIHMSLTRKIQIISGTIILLIFLLSLFYNNAVYAYIGLGLFMLYVGISGNCFMSSILTKGDI
jgi:rhodanese-related sulfurtransferase